MFSVIKKSNVPYLRRTIAIRVILYKNGTKNFNLKQSGILKETSFYKYLASE